MTNELCPDMLEIEYTFFMPGGHNTLKFMDGRLFFFSEADSNLSEKNEYLTRVSIPKKEDWECFWKNMSQIDIWEWEENYRPGEGSSEEGDIWQVKIKRGERIMETKCWCWGPENMDEFFRAVKELAGVDLTQPFDVLSKKLSEG
jgi:hypothetical protein